MSDSTEPLPMPPASGEVIDIFLPGQRPPNDPAGLGSGTGGGVGAGEGQGAPLPQPPPPAPPYEDRLRDRQRVAVVDRARARANRQPPEAEQPERPAPAGGGDDDKGETPVQQVAAAVQAMQAPPRRGTLAGGGARGRQEQPERPGYQGDNRISARAIVRHMADGAGGVVSGAVAAAASAFEAGADFADALDSLTGMGTPGADPAQAPGRVIGRAIRSLDPFTQDTVTGNVSREVTQTLVGFLRGARLLRLAGIAQGPGMIAAAGRAAGAGMIADALFQEAEEGNIGDALVALGVPRNEVTAFFASNPDDTATEARLRNAIGGAATGLALDAMMAVLRGARAAIIARRDGGLLPQRASEGAQAAPPPQTLAEAASQPPSELRDRIIVGDQQRPLFERAPEAMARAEAATEGLDGPVVASQLAYAGQAPGRPGPNVFINWGRIRTTEDVQAVLRDMAEAFRDDVVTAQRGVQSNEETVRLARMMGLTPEELIARQPGQALNAEQAFAARQLYTASGQALLDAARAAQNGGVLEQAAFRRMMAIHHAIQTSVLGARTEAGRALQQWSIPAGAPRAQMRQIEDLLRSTGGTDTSSGMARRLAALAQMGGEPEDVAARIGMFAGKGHLARTIEAVHQYWLNAVLSGVGTHFWNAAGNGLNMMLYIGERAIAGQVAALRGARPGEGTYSREWAWMVYGLSQSFRESLRLAGRTYMDDGQELSALLGRQDWPRQNAISTENLLRINPGADGPARYVAGIDPGTPLGRGIDFVGSQVVSAPGRALGAEDAFFKSMLFRAELHAIAARRAHGNLTAALMREPTGAELGAEMARLMRALPEDMVNEAAEGAIYATFNRQGGEIIRRMQNAVGGESTTAGGALTSFVIRQVITFPRTMGNIFSYGLERSAMAPVVRQWREDIAAGGPRRDAAIARASFGSLAMLWAYDLAESGAISGAGDERRDRRGPHERQGWAPYSMLIGGNWINYNRADPLGFMFGVAADLQHLQSTREMTAETMEEANAIQRDMIVFLGRMVENRTVFQGFSNFAQIFDDQQPTTSRFVAGMLGPLVAPAIATDAARLLDGETERDPRTFMERIQVRIVGLRNNTLPRRNLWGEEELRGAREIAGSEIAAQVVNTVTRGGVRPVRPNPIDTELARLQYSVSPVPDIASFGGVAVNLRQFPQALDRLRVLTGHALRLEDFGGVGLKQALIDMVEGRGPLGARYRTASDTGPGDTKRGIILAVVSRYRTAAREQLLAEFPELRDHIARLSENPDFVRQRMAPGIPRGGAVTVDPPAMR